MQSDRSCLARAAALTSAGTRRTRLSTVPVALGVALSLGVASVSFAQAPAAAEDVRGVAPTSARSSAHPYDAHVTEASQRFGIPEAWIWSVMRVESAGNPTATSHAGAMGLMQVMPGTYAELRSRYGLGPNPYDPRNSILAGAAYLREMHDRYGSAGFLAAYNAGPGRWEAYVSRGRPLPAETVAYMARLGPMVGGSAAPAPAVVMRADRTAWTRAALFVRVRNGATPSATTDEPSAPTLQTVGDGSAPNQLGATQPSTAPANAPTEAPHALFAVRRPE